MPSAIAGAVAPYAEADLLPLSGLQHIIFCERQCALIHLEQVWRENLLTAEGRVLHERVDTAPAEGHGDLRIARSIPLRSFRLGLVGRADIVEFCRVGAREKGARLAGLEGQWKPLPLEYKRGRSKWIDCDRVQLCAQALCLEEMLQVSVLTGALFYGRVRRREEVVFDVGLREATERAAHRFHDIMAIGRTPLVYRAPKCRSCSLLEVCLPPRKRTRRSVGRYLEDAVTKAAG